MVSMMALWNSGFSSVLCVLLLGGIWSVCSLLLASSLVSGCLVVVMLFVCNWGGLGWGLG